MKVSSHNLVSEPGTILHATQQLLYWSENVKEGLTRVESDDVRSQIAALINLRQELSRLNIPVTQVVLNHEEKPISAICGLLDELESLPASLLFIKWSPSAFEASADELVEALRFFAYEHKNRRTGGHRQIWWTSRRIGQLLRKEAPELDRKFTHRLELREKSWRISSGSRNTRRFADSSNRCLDDIRLVRCVVSFLYRRGFNWALTANRPVREMIVDLIAPGVKSLLDVGLESDARNFSNSCLTALSLRETERRAAPDDEASAEPDMPMDMEMDMEDWQRDPENRAPDAASPEMDPSPVNDDWALFRERDPNSGQSWLEQHFGSDFSHIDEIDPSRVIRWANELTIQGQNAQLCRRWDQAETLLLEAFTLNARKFGWGSPNTLQSLRDLALLTEDRGQDTYEPWMEQL